MPQKLAPIDDWIQRYLVDEAPRSMSLMISVFGDSIAPYTEGVWLGDFIELLAPLGLNERLVRTSAFRLVEEGWLRTRREGRRSHYALTAHGTRRFESAYSHIYTAPREQWDGTWTLVLLPRGTDAVPDRSELRRELEWMGFAAPLSGLWVHPTAEPAEVRTTVDRCGLLDQIIVLRAQAADALGPELGNRALARSWHLDEVAARYQRFVSLFEPLLDRLQRITLTPLHAFLVQTLLIHSFRRANLHDPRLPLPMLPADWPGLRAYQLCRALYGRTYALTRAHLGSFPGLKITNARGARLMMAVDQRFGGLPR